MTALMSLRSRRSRTRASNSFSFFVTSIKRPVKGRERLGGNMIFDLYALMIETTFIFAVGGCLMNLHYDRKDK
jgi:hypothetical protein